MTTGTDRVPTSVDLAAALAVAEGPGMDADLSDTLAGPHRPQAPEDALSAAQRCYARERERADALAAEVETLTAERGRLAIALALAEAQLDEALAVIEGRLLT